VDRHERRRITRVIARATGGTIEILDHHGLANLAAKVPSVARCWATWRTRPHACVTCRGIVGTPGIFAFVTVPEAGLGFLRAVCLECVARHGGHGAFTPIGVIGVAALEAEVLAAMARAFRFRGAVRRLDPAHFYGDQPGRA